MKSIITICFLFITSLIFCQGKTIAEIDTNGNLTLETGLSGDDTYFKAISIVVKEGVKTKASNEITINGYELYISYNKDTKIYTLKEDTTTLLETTTVAAIRNQCNAWFYKQITGKPLKST